MSKPATLATAALLQLIPVPMIDGHGAVVVPKPRNALEGGLAPWKEPLKWPIAFADTAKQTPFCPIGVSASNHTSFAGVNGQACYWFSNGCSIGCPECDGVTRGPIPCSHPAGCKGCCEMEPIPRPCDGVRTCQRKMDTCGKGFKATNCNSSTRTLNIGAACGGPTDWYYFSPWRAPGSAPV